MTYIDDLKKEIDDQMLTRSKDKECTAAELGQIVKWFMYHTRGDDPSAGSEEDPALAKRLAQIKDIPDLDMEKDDDATRCVVHD